MRFISILLTVAIALGAAGCSKFERYTGPQVTRVLIYKEQRKLYLMHHDKTLREYDVGLGFAPVGHKQVRGDGRTPIGEYKIDRRNPNSEFHLSIGISYPNTADRAFARSLGESPGGDIFIHGRPWKYRKGGQDWTAGCIAVNNQEIQEIYAMVTNGTPISIYP
jgi:murein L,D-transpeptidase YafK